MTAGTTAKLGDIAEIFGGLSSRECPKADIGHIPPNGFKQAALVTMSAVGDVIDQAKLQRVWVKTSHLDESLPRSVRLRAGDLIFINRYNPRVHLVHWSEAYMKEDASIRCVPANTLIVIRPKAEGEALVARSQYLEWLLNHPRLQQKMHILMHGAEVKSLTNHDLINLEIPVPAEDKGIDRTTSEGVIAYQYHKLLELRAKMRELTELEFQRAQARLYEMALGKMNIRSK